MISANTDALVLALVGAGYAFVLVQVVWHVRQSMSHSRMSQSKRARILKELDSHIESKEP